ncbi:MAG TPA: M50 family metallopeptidase [Beutenbergiaceae bacterium]|nr:M50 family metallopeptidase [Beutenbergiaceae bacterium]
MAHETTYDTLGQSSAKLHPSIEVVEGMDRATLLYDARTKNYARIGDTAAKVVASIEKMADDVTIEQVVRSLSEQNRASEEAVWEKVGPMFAHLDQMGILRDSTQPSTNQSTEYEFTLLRRYPLVTDPGRIFGPFRILFKKFPGSVAGALLGIVVLASIVILAITLPGIITEGINNITFGAAAIALLFTTFIHEAAHAALLVRYEVPPREAGVGLLFGFLPVAYVDRSDSYRIVEKRKRVLVSLIGPLTDLSLAGVAAFASFYVSGNDGMILSNLSLLLFVVFLINLNPILPTDGAHALEALTGEINVHSRAFTYVFGRFFGKSQKAQSHAAQRGRPILYYGVIILTVLWLCVIAASIFFTILGLVS